MIFFFSKLTFSQRLYALLTLKALFLIAVILYAGIGLGPDEAQYWTWSQALDLGYYSKPPGIAWQIWLGTKIFGQTEWGVRSITVILSFIQALLLYRLALSAGLLQRTAFWCGVFMAFCPLGILGSLFAITDVGFLLCWTGACLVVVKALNERKEANLWLISLWIMIGALFKWPIYLFWLFVLLSRSMFSPNQKLSSLLMAALLSLIGLLPSVWWNISHDWATFRHVFATLQGGSGNRASGNIGEFLASQALLLSPILFILLLFALWSWFRERKSLPPPLYFCGLITLTTLGFATLLSCFQKIQGNWVIYAYPTGLVLLGWNAFQRDSVNRAKQLWVKIGLGFSLLLIVLFALLPSLYLVPRFAPYAMGFRYSPFKHNLGWSQFTESLTRAGYDPKKDFLFSDKYQTVSELSFYGPGQKRAYFLNLLKGRKNQFSYWPCIQEERQNQSGYFVWVENAPRLEKDWNEKKLFYQKELEHYFEKVKFITFFSLIYEQERTVKGGLIFRCQNCKEMKPEGSLLY